jgi:hypothetical protein
MKKILIFSILLLAGCSEGDGLLKPIPLSAGQLRAVNELLSDKYQEITRCDILAKCMGFDKGLVQAEYISMKVYGGHYYNYEGNRFTCQFFRADKMAKQVGANEIQAMLDGCMGKKCTKKECAK